MSHSFIVVPRSLRMFQRERRSNKPATEPDGDVVRDFLSEPTYLGEHESLCAGVIHERCGH